VRFGTLPLLIYRYHARKSYGASCTTLRRATYTVLVTGGHEATFLEGACELWKQKNMQVSSLLATRALTGMIGAHGIGNHVSPESKGG
jgi:hypothetical protein